MNSRVSLTGVARRRRAAATVEFAVVTPLLFLLVFGMIEFGRMLMVQQILVNSAREGARQAVLAGATDAQAQAAVDAYLRNAGITTQTRTVAPSTDAAQSGTAITVTVTLPCQDVSWLPALRFLSTTKLSASVVMRKEDR